MTPYEAIKDIRCAGEAMVELIVEPDGNSARIGIAGDVLNSAIYLRRSLPRDATVSFVSAAGKDRFSEKLTAFVKANNISTGYLAGHEARTVGLYAINTDARGERTFQYWRNQSAARVMFGPDGDPDFSGLKGADLIYLSAITLAILTPAIRTALIEELKEQRANGTLIAFDSNFRPALWETVEDARVVISAMWQITDIGFPSIDDEMALFDEDNEAAQKRLSSYEMPLCILKRGDKGPAIISGAQNVGELDFPAAVNVVDTTGAGDSFNGTFMGSLTSGSTIEEACQKAHAMASKVVGERGAIINQS